MNASTVLKKDDWGLSETGEEIVSWLCCSEVKDQLLSSIFVVCEQFKKYELHALYVYCTILFFQ